jgi:hypothetical protein
MREGMRFVCGLMLWLVAAANLWAQREPCLAATDIPDCGIKIIVNPPLKPPDENVIWAPSEVTIDVPLRLHPSKVRLNSAPTGSDVAEFKLFAETARYKKVDSFARYQMEIKNCPEGDNGFVFNILSPRLPYPIVVNSKPFECKQRATK